MRGFPVFFPLSKEQSGFIKGRSIHENIGLAHEMVAELDRHIFGGNLLFKLDMSNAYDKVSWTYLLQVMRQFGFSEAFCDLIYRNISNCWYTISLNGIYYGFFKSSRGLRQGDPLSPSFFIQAQDALSRNLNAMVHNGTLQPFHVGRGMHSLSHLMFADDMILF